MERYVKILDHEVGHYSVTQVQKMSIMYKGKRLEWGKILDYREFKVLDRDLTIIMEG